MPATVDDRVQHLHERAGERQVRPARIGGDVEEHDAAVAAHARRSPAACRRGARPRPPRRASASGSASTCRFTAHVRRHRDAGERAVGGKLADRLRLLPGERAAERPLALPEPHRQQLVDGGGGEVRAGEAKQRAAGLHPFDQAPAVVSGGSVPVSVSTMIEAPRSDQRGHRLARARRRRSGGDRPSARAPARHR